MSDFHPRSANALLASALLAFALSAVLPASAQTLDDNMPQSSQKGWRGLAKVLDALSPSVDTSIPPSASQITDRITRLLDQGRNDEALQAIEARKQELAGASSPGTDVQLMFLEARALSALARHDEATAIYRRMTVDYPELPEPWNNLGTEYFRMGQLERAREALQMALMANPNYATAQANLGAVQLQLAQQAFEKAASSGVPGAQEKAQQTGSILDGQPSP
ncbi:tetratricopeptide repeat protein [Paracandidimonas soli]|uniref:Tetratricopeptide repeat protein n=1 Tax=Paracandidimonas soli TaxID=1917182 RepID=A0A4R3UV03_9BURK|nr:tetratricopeptide repeat protein [Paracandidimonas soli]TCU94513.1 tetratricopeptide repeat protein [Paracandidimonas soli]